MIETLLEFMGRFDFSSKKQRYIPYISSSWRIRPLPSDVTNSTLGHSPTQARAILVVFASLIHAVFFLIMGTGPQYPSLLIAYALAAFARAFLTGASLP
jgi:hypothetical protein